MVSHWVRWYVNNQNRLRIDQAIESSSLFPDVILALYRAMITMCQRNWEDLCCNRTRKGHGDPTWLIFFPWNERVNSQKPQRMHCHPSREGIQPSSCRFLPLGLSFEWSSFCMNPNCENGFPQGIPYSHLFWHAHPPRGHAFCGVLRFPIEHFP